MEIWKPVIGFESCYAVSNIGRVKSLFRIVNCRKKVRRSVPEKILKPSPDKYGYLCVTLQEKPRCKTCKIHRLVAGAFFGPSELTVNHKNLNKTDNRVENLEYMTAIENSLHARSLKQFNTPKGKDHHSYKITPEIRLQIKELRKKLSYKEIGQIFNLHPHTCYRVCRS